MKRQNLNLIWCQPKGYLWEEEWIRWLFSGFDVTENFASGLDVFKDRSVYVLSSNYHSLGSLPESFLRGVSELDGKGLFHLSDEWYSGGYETYAHFDFVLRKYHSSIFDNPGIKTLPLGLTNGGMNEGPLAPASSRPFVWSFSGTKTAARLRMFDALETIGPNRWFWYDLRAGETPPLDREAFKALLADSVFSPCPMGNVVLETFRVYESLEMGAIPLIEQRPWMPYYDRLLPGHPLPSFTSWRSARRFVDEMAADKAKLDRLQSLVHDWWLATKSELQRSVTSFTDEGMEGRHRRALAEDWHCGTGARHQIWRMAELVRHGNRASLLERAGIFARRAVRAGKAH